MEEVGGSYDLCGEVIGPAMKVPSGPGAGFFELVYRHALVIELRRGGCEIETECLIEVVYAGEIVGTFAADLLAKGRLIVELKATQCLLKVYEVQVVNYLTPTSVDEGLVLNFGGPRLSTRKSSECTNQSQ